MDGITIREVLKLRNEEKFVEEDSIITEYPFTIFLNGKEFITLLCTQSSLDYLLVGFLVSEGLIDKKEDIESIKIDEEKGIGYVETVKKTNLMEKLYGKRTLTSGCGKGTVFYSVVDSFKSTKCVFFINASFGSLNPICALFPIPNTCISTPPMFFMASS